jgi:hypothetical protein
LLAIPVAQEHHHHIIFFFINTIISTTFTMRFLIAFLLVLGLSLVSAQTTSDTSTISLSTTTTSSLSPTQTIPTPPAPPAPTNVCPNHIQYICVGFDTNAATNYDIFRVYYQLSGSTTITRVLAPQGSFTVTIGPGLLPSSTYNVWVQGMDSTVGAFSFNSTTTVFTTQAPDPKMDPTLDIQNFGCVVAKNPNGNGRTGVQCTWTAAQATVIHINVKVHCVSKVAPIREPVTIRKRLWGSKAIALSAFFAVNRDNADCNVYARFYYARRATTRHHSFVSI